MGRVLRRAGLGVWLATIWLALAELSGMVPEGIAEAWLWRGAWAGAGLLGAGLLLGVMTPVSRELRRGRCVRCGARIERHQTYCSDHLQATVNEYRDRHRVTSS